MSTDQATHTISEALQTPITRRRALQLAAAAGAAAFLGGTTAARVAAQSPAATSVGGSFRMATWIGYIDIGPDGSSHPSLDRFQAETGVAVDYKEAVNSNEEFFASQLQGPLSNGLSTGSNHVRPLASSTRSR